MPLSQKQMEYLALAWACFKSEPQIDYDKFREVAGLASAHSARELMRVTKKKLHAEYGTISESSRTAASKSATPTTTPNRSAVRKSALHTSSSSSSSKKVAGAAASTGAARRGGSTKEARQKEFDEGNMMEDVQNGSQPVDGYSTGIGSTWSQNYVSTESDDGVASPAAKRQRVDQPVAVVKAEIDEDPGFY